MGVSLGDRTWLRRLGWATLVGNIGIVLTGGAVRLTGSGLGCPTWPRCTDRSFTPHGALDVHSAIEFGNRTLTFVLTAIAIATFVSAWRSGRHDLRRLALLLGLSIPAQAVLGGITVLTDLNPWVVAFHLLFSMGIISLAVLYLWRIDHCRFRLGRLETTTSHRARLDDVRRRLAGAHPGHDRHRLGSARRRRELAAQRARPACRSRRRTPTRFSCSSG